MSYFFIIFWSIVLIFDIIGMMRGFNSNNTNQILQNGFLAIIASIFILFNKEDK